MYVINGDLSNRLMLIFFFPLSAFVSNGYFPLSRILGKTLGQKSTIAPSFLEIKSSSLEKTFSLTHQKLLSSGNKTEASSQCTASWPWESTPGPKTDVP